MNQEKYDAILTALVNLGKLLKTVRYYPSTHPALQTASNEALLLFSPLLQEGNLPLTVRKEGFWVGQTPIGKDLPILKNLAYFLFARRIHSILFLAELCGKDLSAFARAVILPPDEIKRAGGLQELLLKSHVVGIWLNEIDLAKIQAAREQMAAQGLGEEEGLEEIEEYHEGAGQGGAEEGVPSESGPTPKNLLEEVLASTLDLGQLLDQLSREVSDQRFSLLAAKLHPKVLEHLQAEGMPLVLRSISLMKKLSEDPSLSTDRRRDAVNTLQKLAAEEILDFLATHLCAKETPQNLRDSIAESLSAFQEKGTQFLIYKLAEEENAQSRRHLSEALILQGPSSLPALVEALGDSRWYVTRNIVLILGKIQNPKIAGYLRPYLEHKEPRVAREAVRALARIGGPMAVKSLLQAVETADEEIRVQAFLALGVMKDEMAVAPLIQFIRTPDPFMKRMELKKAAIKALGAIGSPDAEPGLQQLLKQRRLWRRSRFDTLRSCAAHALGQIGGEDSLSVLESATADRSKHVARAANQALSHLKKRMAS